MVYETKFPRQHSASTATEDCSDDSEVIRSDVTAAVMSQSHTRLYRPSFLLIQVQQILTYEDSVAAHLSKILTSDQHSVVISSAKYVFVCRSVCPPVSVSQLTVSSSVLFRVLCETVKDFVARVGKAYEKNTESSEESEAMAKKVCLLVVKDVLLFSPRLLS